MVNPGRIFDLVIVMEDLVVRTNREMLDKMVIISIKNTFHLRLFFGECVRVCAAFSSGARSDPCAGVDACVLKCGPKRN